MKKNYEVVLLALVVNSSVTRTEGWGPLTHQSIASFGWISEPIPTPNPNTSIHMPSFILGCSSPDAFNQNPAVPPPPGWKGNSPMHSFEFSGYQMLYALDPSASRDYNPDFCPISFALGYGSHMAMDYVAHDRRGFISVGGPEYELELAVDTLMYFNESRFVYFPEDAASFISNATKYWHDHGGRVQYNTSSISMAASLFDVALHTELGVLAVNHGYQKQLVRFSRYNVSSYEQDFAYLEMALRCSAEASRFWMQTLLSNLDPLAAEKATVSFINSLFTSGMCGPRVNATVAANPLRFSKENFLTYFGLYRT
eukprot:m.125501 g.125501  ORF g.125501 m.125501 type:complete len:312 (+) comp29132_c0_seq2:234-1169(+)